jgi:hypothetical protein
MRHKISGLVFQARSDTSNVIYSTLSVHNLVRSALLLDQRFIKMVSLQIFDSTFLEPLSQQQRLACQWPRSKGTWFVFASKQSCFPIRTISLLSC